MKLDIMPVGTAKFIGSRLAFVATLLALALSTVSCGKQKSSASPIATQTPIPLSLEVRIVHSRDGFRSHEFTIMEHRFTTTSGGYATYNVGGLHLTVQPKANGDRTVTTVASFSDEQSGLTAESFSITSIEGQAMTHQVGDVRIAFGVTIDPQRMAIMDATESAVPFVEGYYSWPSDEVFQFLGGQFIDYNYYSATLGRLTARRVGPYRVNGDRIIVRFDDPKPSEVVFYHRVVEGVHLLLNKTALPYVDALSTLPVNDSYGVYVRRPEAKKSGPDWWGELLGAHPKMAEIFLNYRDAKRDWRDGGVARDLSTACGTRPPQK